MTRINTTRMPIMELEYSEADGTPKEIPPEVAESIKFGQDLLSSRYSENELAFASCLHVTDIINHFLCEGGLDELGRTLVEQTAEMVSALAHMMEMKHDRIMSAFHDLTKVNDNINLIANFDTMQANDESAVTADLCAAMAAMKGVAS